MLKCGIDFIEGLSDEPFKRYHGKSVKCINSKKFLLVFALLFHFRVLDEHYAPILVSVCEKFRQDYINGLQREWASLFLLQWRDCWVEAALSQTMARYVQCLII